ncbi:MAG: hypothetical protein J0M11_05505 [Anaerolineae bacterium]|nr:hypothetical protein [Anaerolineae bacterium]
MSSELRNQIYVSLNSKDTDELLDIWKKNDRLEWSALAFEVLEEILTKRITTLPKQDKPILEKDDSTDDDLEDWEAKILDSENQPELYDTLEVINLVDSINKVAKAVVVVYIIIYIINSSVITALFTEGLMAFGEISIMVRNLLIVILSAALQIVIVYFPLKALSHILRILMEMEFNSRKQ